MVDALDPLRKAAPFPGGIAPSYDGHGLINVAHTALAALGVPAGPGLAAEFLPPELTRGVERVLLVLVDGLGWEQLRATSDKLALRDAGKEGVLAPITSVSPSTTTSAIATLLTGEPPIRHGMLGYRLYLREVGGVANMIRFGPVTGGASFDTRGFEPRAFFSTPTIFERARAAGVHAAVVTRKDYVGSALSKMLHAGSATEGFASMSDMGVLAQRALAGGKRSLVFAYWDLLDGIAHRYGALGEEYRAELSLLDHALDRQFFSRRGDGKTLILLTGDHGHINVPPENRLDVRQTPGVLDDLLLPPAGEPRLAYLYAKSGRKEALQETLLQAYGKVGAVLPADESIRRGYFGSGPPHAAAADRLGDLHLMPTRDHAFLFPFPGEKGDLIGRHGGFTPEEMLVPLLAVRR